MLLPSQITSFYTLHQIKSYLIVRMAGKWCVCLLVLVAITNVSAKPQPQVVDQVLPYSQIVDSVIASDPQHVVDPIWSEPIVYGTDPTPGAIIDYTWMVDSPLYIYDPLPTEIIVDPIWISDVPEPTPSSQPVVDYTWSIGDPVYVEDASAPVPVVDPIWIDNSVNDPPSSDQILIAPPPLISNRKNIKCVPVA